MANVISKITLYLTILIYTILPTFSAQYTTYKQADDDVKLTVALMSDTHLNTKVPAIRNNFKYGLKNLKKINNLDGLVIDGDLTTYGDEKSLSSFYDCLKKYSPTQNTLVVSGNHDIGHTHNIGMTSDEARSILIKKWNEFSGSDENKIYFTKRIGEYKFIVLSDEGSHWDECTMTNEQLAFLDREIASENGRPVFVCCHWPMQGKNGEDTVSIHNDGCYADENDVDGFENEIMSVLNKYKNVFWISGHMHKGLDDKNMSNKFGFRWAETDENGVNYINLPTYGLVNMYGVTWWGTGAVMEVYENKVVFKGINYRSGLEIKSARTTFDLEG